jgi:hypothetical protein
VLQKSRTGAAVPFATRSRGRIHRLTPAHQRHRRRAELGEGDERRRHATDARVEWHGGPMSPVANYQTKTRIPLMYVSMYSTLACLPFVSIE